MSLAVSFEFFPPRTDEMEAQLWRSIARLAPAADFTTALSQTRSLRWSPDVMTSTTASSLPVLR